MAFTDALIDHAAINVTLVDRRHAAGGHWQDAYPFVQLHQASLFYGVASMALGTGAVQGEEPEASLQDAPYLLLTIPATTLPLFGVVNDVHVVAVNELVRLTAAPSDFVVVGSGKTATDGIVWLLANGVPPDRIVWEHECRAGEPRRTIGADDLDPDEFVPTYEARFQAVIG